jgi:hypothetical protein
VPRANTPQALDADLSRQLADRPRVGRVVVHQPQCVADDRIAVGVLYGRATA